MYLNRMEKYVTEKEFKNATFIADIYVNYEIKMLLMDTSKIHLLGFK